jgi:hypothetical protein
MDSPDRIPVRLEPRHPRPGNPHTQGRKWFVVLCETTPRSASVTAEVSRQPGGEPICATVTWAGRYHVIRFRSPEPEPPATEVVMTLVVRATARGHDPSPPVHLQVRYKPGHEHGFGVEVFITAPAVDNASGEASSDPIINAAGTKTEGSEFTLATAAKIEEETEIPPDPTPPGARLENWNRDCPGCEFGARYIVFVEAYKDGLFGSDAITVHINQQSTKPSSNGGQPQ